MKKIFFSMLLAIISCLPTFAEKTVVEITPIQKITTATNKLAEGDYVEFKILNSEDKIRGLIVRYQENGFGGQEAILVIDQFRAINSDKKYEGTLVINGNQHNGVMEWLLLDFATYVRGGEVTIRPNKDIFTIWRL